MSEYSKCALLQFLCKLFFIADVILYWDYLEQWIAKIYFNVNICQALRIMLTSISENELYFIISKNSFGQGNLTSSKPIFYDLQNKQVMVQFL